MDMFAASQAPDAPRASRVATAQTLLAFAHCYLSSPLFIFLSLFTHVPNSICISSLLTTSLPRAALLPSPDLSPVSSYSLARRAIHGRPNRTDVLLTVTLNC
jgi:hypothetical protein